MRSRPLALLAIATAVASGCRGGEGSPPDAPASLEGLGLDTVFSIGAAEGEAWEAFGGIWDVEAGPDGRLAVLDLETPAVHVYDDTGAHMGSIVETGLDAGALDTPSGLAWSAAGELLVWDPGSSWISRFAVDDDGVAFRDRSRAFAFGETGFCSIRGRSYLSYFQDGQVVHEIGAEGPIGSFGPAPHLVGVETLGPELQEIAIEELTPSALLCTSEGVLEVSFYTAQIRLHDLGGPLRWGRDLDDFRPISVYTPDGMGLGRAFDAVEGSHLLRSVVPWGPTMALVQHELRTEEIPPEGEREVFESRLIRLEDGVEVERTRDLPLLLSAHGARLYQVVAHPFPRVLALDASGASDAR